ncbi:MAG TPA: hypothetical protein VFC51_03365 [Chloroflexota bacterium]|nr:hypothetical protein [Chloroflexota bacterium]
MFTGRLVVLPLSVGVLTCALLVPASYGQDDEEQAPSEEVQPSGDERGAAPGDEPDC